MRSMHAVQELPLSVNIHQRCFASVGHAHSPPPCANCATPTPPCASSAPSPTTRASYFPVGVAHTAHLQSCGASCTLTFSLPMHILAASPLHTSGPPLQSSDLLRRKPFVLFVHRRWENVLRFVFRLPGAPGGWGQAWARLWPITHPSFCPCPDKCGHKRGSVHADRGQGRYFL